MGARGASHTQSKTMKAHKRNSHTNPAPLKRDKEKKLATSSHRACGYYVYIGQNGMEMEGHHRR